MSIAEQYLHLYREVFAFPGVLADPFLVFGYQDIPEAGLPKDFNFRDVKALLQAKRLKDIHIMVLFDDRARGKKLIMIMLGPRHGQRVVALMKKILQRISAKRAARSTHD